MNKILSELQLYPNILKPVEDECVINMFSNRAYVDCRSINAVPHEIWLYFNSDGYLIKKKYKEYDKLIIFEKMYFLDGLFTLKVINENNIKLQRKDMVNFEYKLYDRIHCMKYKRQL